MATDDPFERYRPHDDGTWPDDAVTVTYSELRQLIALHLHIAAQSMPRTAPWTWVEERARATADGEVPLLLSEVVGKGG